VHLRDKPLAEDIDFKRLGTMTGGMSGAQIAGMCNTASFIASREGRSEVTMSDMVKAVEQSKYGRAYEVHKFVSPTRKKRCAALQAGAAAPHSGALRACAAAAAPPHSAGGRFHQPSLLASERWPPASTRHPTPAPLRPCRLAVMEGSISLVATLMPALEPVQAVTIVPSIKSPIGRTVLSPSYARFTTGVYTRRCVWV
jgi:hypothetical protein